MRVNLLINRTKRHKRHLLYPLPHPLPRLYPNHLVQLGQGQDVAVLELTVVLAVLLDCVVGEMDVVVADVAQGEGLAGSADVALLEEVKLEGVGQERPDADVELAGVD